MAANDGETSGTTYAKYDRPPPASPVDMAAITARTRRLQRLRSDAETLMAAAQIARRRNCPSLDNACTTLARALDDEACNYYKPLKTIDVKDGML